jgi:hypothetical protein
MPTRLEGGCHCRALRYRIGAAPSDSGYCHCRICQQTTGAPVLAWATVPIEAFAMLGGRAAVYRSSDWGERHFCGTCGAQILYRDTDRPATVSINVASLDDPGALPPRCHIHTGSQIAWFDVADDLPRHREAKDEP